ncbi:hypothetical protein KSS87_016158 [Heliosperma pusillum]|nr:hypothetical protein KSS87_016158 [Heliosperma pusillum]
MFWNKMIDETVGAFLYLDEKGIALLRFKERVVNDPFEALTSWNGNIDETCPCSWFGIQCADGHVISLNLENLCLEGTLAPELQHLLYIKSINLRNNSFYGMIPRKLGALKELKVVNLGYNNLIRPFPHEFEYDIPVLLLDNNGQSCHISYQLKKLTSPIDISLANRLLSTLVRQDGEKRTAVHSRRLEESSVGNSSSPPPLQEKRSSDGALPPSPSPPNNGNPFQPPTPVTDSTAITESVPPPPQTQSSSPTKSQAPIFAGVGIGLGFIVLSLAVGVFFWRGKKIRKTADSPKGLTGQLQRAFVSGVQNLRRFELDTACEDLSNVIGTCSIGKIYKGTLSNGVEIAVISLEVLSAKDWSKNLESQFRKKIETLSKVHHKNFINLIGYCEEEEPFTRMMVFEYAPNGSLFEHLHVREAEHLDWGMRLRVATGMAYCLEHMHQLSPPVTHPNLNSASIHLSEDYATKISDFCFWNEVAALQVQPIDLANLRTSTTSPQSNVYNYGLVMLELITGRIPHTVMSSEAVDDWVSEYLSGEKPVQELVDPMLRRFKQDQLDKVSELIKNCLHSDPKLRPTMKDVSAGIKEITGIDREKAGPRLSPLWWSELESRGSVNGEQPA